MHFSALVSPFSNPFSSRDVESCFAAAWSEQAQALECEWLVTKRSRGGGTIRVGVTDASVPFVPIAPCSGGLALYLDVQSCRLYGTEFACSAMCSFRTLKTMHKDLPSGTRISMRVDTTANLLRFSIDGGQWINAINRGDGAFAVKGGVAVRPLVWISGAAGDGVRLLSCRVVERPRWRRLARVALRAGQIAAFVRMLHERTLAPGGRAAARAKTEFEHLCAIENNETPAHGDADMSHRGVATELK